MINVCRLPFAVCLLVPLLAGLPIACNEPEARRPVEVRSSSYIDESVTKNKAQVEAEDSALLKWIEKDSLREYIGSDTGFWYYYVDTTSTGDRTPEFGDRVEYEYEVRALNGRLLYSLKSQGKQTYLMDKERLITGLREGLKLMKEGQTVTFVFPSYKAYGYYGDGGKIGMDMPVIYTVTLNKIE